MTATIPPATSGAPKPASGGESKGLKDGALGLLSNTVIAIASVTKFWDPAYGNTSWTLPFYPDWHIGGVFLTGAGALILGVVLMIVYRMVNPPFFKGETLDRDTPVLVPET